MSRSLPRSRPHAQQSTGAPLERGTKKYYPILQVAVYDVVGNLNKVIELP